LLFAHTALLRRRQTASIDFIAERMLRMQITAHTQALPLEHRQAGGAGLVQKECGPAQAPAQALATPHDFVMQLASHHIDEPAFRAKWAGLVAAGDSPQKIYQTPEFFTVLQRTHGPSERVEVMSLKRLSDGATLGVVPVRIGRRTLPFQLGPLTLGSISVEMVTLLGSVPAFQGSAAMTEYIAAQLLEQFPSCKAVLMPALSKNSTCYRHIEQFDGKRDLATALIGPWRDCHTLPVPPTFDQYMQNFSSKKRYNLNRQIRQLSDQAGALRLERIESVHQVPVLMAALAQVATPAELAPLLGEATLACIAEQGMLQSYVLHANEVPAAVIMGTRSAHVLHVHNILVDKAYLSLSIGTSAMHLAIQDIVSMERFSLIDFGYGTPNSESRSSHVLDTRAQLLLFDRMKSSSMLFISYTAFLNVSELVVGMAKSLRKTLHSFRKVKLA
jgi:hypothetical protein